MIVNLNDYFCRQFEIMIQSITKDKLFAWINIGLVIGFGVFIYFDLAYLGLAICFTSMGLLSLIAVYFNTKPLGLGIGGFDYAMRQLFKEYHNRYFNLTFGIIELIFGIGSIIKLVS
ncbi:MAG: hypothetical protein BroJett042_09700 [Bacteroidota bacterium]|nr:MAG: hypothetical protein BroJett042_09700 [Bacteroidota bacterium]